MPIMTIGYIASSYGRKQFGENYKKTLDFFSDKNYQVMDTLESGEMISQELSTKEQQMLYESIFRQLHGVDVIVVDTSYSSAETIFGVSYFLAKQIPVIVLYSKNSQNRDVFSSFSKEMVVHEYTDNSLPDVLEKSIRFLSN